uniref:Uncharacterized protein n=1 Tax=Caenorhabditis japonica TaxID=281687 RepID=A0A8R1J218_CAEJA
MGCGSSDRPPSISIGRNRFIKSVGINGRRAVCVERDEKIVEFVIDCRKPWILMGHVMENAKDAYDRIESKYLDDLERAAKKRNTSVTPRNINFHISNWLVAAK